MCAVRNPLNLKPIKLNKEVPLLKDTFYSSAFYMDEFLLFTISTLFSIKPQFVVITQSH